jgi:16S rRNA (uracil1498-N3)-methyltransferase
VRRVHHAGAPGSESLVVLDRDESKHVLRVLRLGPGDAVSVFDGRGREWEGVLESVHGSEVRVRVGQELAGEIDPALEVVLFQALCRHDRMEWAIQKAAEIGIAEIRPIRSERVEAREPSVSRLERWQRIALEACKQSGRRRVPRVAPPIGLPPPAPDPTLALALGTGAHSTPFRAYTRGAPPGAVWVAVGPEGGFSDADLATLRERDWREAGLGPRTLRTETAGLVAATLVLHAWGDLGSGEEDPGGAVI